MNVLHNLFFHLLNHVFPLLVLKGIYHYVKYMFFTFSRGLNQMEVVLACSALPPTGALACGEGSCGPDRMATVTSIGHGLKPWVKGEMARPMTCDVLGQSLISGGSQ